MPELSPHPTADDITPRTLEQHRPALTGHCYRMLGSAADAADADALPDDTTPDELLSLRQSIRLAFVAALQHLPPRQRAMLLLTDVLGWSAAEAADCLEVSVAAVNSALQRARSTLSTLDFPPDR